MEYSLSLWINIFIHLNLLTTLSVLCTPVCKPLQEIHRNLIQLYSNVSLRRENMPYSKYLDISLECDKTIEDTIDFFVNKPCIDATVNQTIEEVVCKYCRNPNMPSCEAEVGCSVPLCIGEEDLCRDRVRALRKCTPRKEMAKLKKDLSRLKAQLVIFCKAIIEWKNNHCCCNFFLDATNIRKYTQECDDIGEKKKRLLREYVYIVEKAEICTKNYCAAEYKPKK